MLRPPDAKFEEMNHIHVLQGTEAYLRRLQVKPQFNRTSDAYLLYCPGFKSNHNFLLIDLIWEDAHAITENMSVMHEYVQLARRFRERY